jgi:hypothetical protein
VIRGTAGDDLLRSEAGRDTLIGNGGNDVFVIDAGEGEVVVDTGSSTAQAHNALVLPVTLDQVGLRVEGGDVLLAAGETGRRVRHLRGASGETEVAALFVIDAQGAQLHWTVDPAGQTLSPGIQIADRGGSHLTLCASRDQALLGGVGSDTLAVAASGAFLSGGNGADRYAIGRFAAEAIVVDNDAEDGVEDTLRLDSVTAKDQLLLSRVDDDLWLSERPAEAEGEPVPGVVVLDYYREASRRHLALQLGETQVSASELEAWALSDDTEERVAPAAYTAQLDRLIERMAGFASGAGTGTLLPSAPPASPLGGLAVA